ncbi:TetR/AcrR family transcriptional regulator [Lolliginicoccus suaedae]|uniref:TetR/AcrR family transcriptional regulator n=1 Tax=Lolliginicoccus suaedae TaxID=2605429 RepID=UPI0011ED1F8F|nr:TetR family transcriptional regulator [Lolliginicoccus suaedae]
MHGTCDDASVTPASPSPAPTPKGERRKQALIQAAADQFEELGLDAVTHRAVARRAGLPLASTTYYFATRDDVLAAAFDRSGQQELERLERGASGRAADRAGVPGQASELAGYIAKIIAGGPAASRRIPARVERMMAAVRRPVLRPHAQRVREAEASILAEVLARAGRVASEDATRTIRALLDGVLLESLIGGAPDAEQMVARSLEPVLDALAPVQASPGSGTSSLGS